MGTLLVAYDIPQDRRRDRVAKALLRWGQRVQYSVFLLERGGIEEVKKGMVALCEDQEDNIRIQPLCANCAAKVVLLGMARQSEKPGYRVV